MAEAAVAMHQILLCGGKAHEKDLIARKLGGLHFDIAHHWTDEKAAHSYKREQIPRHLAGIIAIRDQMDAQAYQRITAIANLLKIPFVKWDRDWTMVLRRLGDAGLLPTEERRSSTIEAEHEAEHAQRLMPWKHEPPPTPPPAPAPAIVPEQVAAVAAPKRTGRKSIEWDKTCRVTGCQTPAGPKYRYICREHREKLSAKAQRDVLAAWAAEHGKRLREGEGRRAAARAEPRPTARATPSPAAATQKKRILSVDQALALLSEALWHHERKTKQILINVDAHGALTARRWE